MAHLAASTANIAMSQLRLPCSEIRRIRTVVSHSAVEAGNQHETLVKDLVDLLLVGLDSDNTVLGETPRSVSQQSDALEQVLDQDGLEDVELELTVRSGDRDGSVVPNNLGGDHGQGLALGRVDLSGHDGRTGLVLGQREFTKTASRSGSEVSDVVGDLHQGDGDRVHGTGSLDDGIVSGQSLELRFHTVRKRFNPGRSRFRRILSNRQCQ